MEPYQSAPDGERSKRQVRLPRWLRDVAVLTVGLQTYAKDLTLPREVAVSFCASGQVLAWLVEPEQHWRPYDDAVKGGMTRCAGYGLPAALVAEQLRNATRGCRLYSRDHQSAAAWLAGLFRRCGVEGVCNVRDLWSLACTSRSPRHGLSAENLDWAQNWAMRTVPDIPRAATDVVRETTLLLELARLTAR